jgi:hypothetical protein
VIDDQAAAFLKQRTAIMQSGHINDTISSISDDQHSSGSYASTALRSLLCMLPFNINLGHELIDGSRSNPTDGDQDEFL